MSGSRIQATCQSMFTTSSIRIKPGSRVYKPAALRVQRVLVLQRLGLPAQSVQSTIHRQCVQALAEEILAEEATAAAAAAEAPKKTEDHLSPARQPALRQPPLPRHTSSENKNTSNKAPSSPDMRHVFRKPKILQQSPPTPRENRTLQPSGES